MEIDLNQILVDVIKLDRNLQDSIKRKVEEKIVEKIVDKYTKEYFEEYWNKDSEKIKDNVVKELSKEQLLLIKRVLKSYTEKLSYWSKDKTQKAYEKFKNAVEQIDEDLPKEY